MKNGTALLLIAGLLLFSACTAGHNSLANLEAADGNVAGFWLGLWHGFIVLFSFIASLFKENVGIYEVHNSGGWYDFGFLMGVMMFFGGSQGGGKKACSRRKIEVTVTNKDESEVA